MPDPTKDPEVYKALFEEPPTPPPLNQSQRAACDWVDAVMRRAVGLVRKLTAQDTAVYNLGESMVPPNRPALEPVWNRSRLVDTYVSAAIEIASQGIVVSEYSELPDGTEARAMPLIEGCSIRLPGLQHQDLSQSLVANLEWDAQVTEDSIRELARETRRVERVGLTINWQKNITGSVMRSWTAAYAYSHPEVVLEELAKAFIEEVGRGPVALMDYVDEPDPYADHSCGGECNPLTAAEGAIDCRTCPANPNLKAK